MLFWVQNEFLCSFMRYLQKMHTIKSSVGGSVCLSVFHFRNYLLNRFRSNLEMRIRTVSHEGKWKFLYVPNYIINFT
jgi:hypothetical protein